MTVIQKFAAVVVIAAATWAGAYVAWRLTPLHPMDGSYAGKNMAAVLGGGVALRLVALPLAAWLFPCSLAVLHKTNSATEIGEIETCRDCGRKWVLSDKRYPAVGAGDWSPRYKEIHNERRETA